MVRNVRCLTLKNKEDFFKDIRLGEIFTANFDEFLGQDVRKEASKNKVYISYMGPGTKEYRNYGCSTWRVEGFTSPSAYSDLVETREFMLSDLPKEVSNAIYSAFMECDVMDIYEGNVLMYLQIIRDKIRQFRENISECNEELITINKIIRKLIGK